MSVKILRNNNLLSIIIFCLISVIYFIFLKSFYIKDYDTTDFFSYSNWYNKGIFLSRDGFSTLFILISNYSREYYKLYQITSLLLLASSLFFFNVTAIYIQNKIYKSLYVLLNLSLGSFYYFYGKIYYEFPFISFLVSILFFSIIFLKINNKIYKNISLIFISTLFGFIFSWKPTAIFPLYGLLIFTYLIDNQIVKYLLFKKFYKLILCFLFLLIGYLIGNYGFIINFKDTYYNIFSYAGFNGVNNLDHGELLKKTFDHFIFKDDKFVFDHVTKIEFNYGVFNLFSLFTILFIVPFLLKANRLILIFNVSILFLYTLFIYLISPGNVWHAFPFSLYLIFISFAYFFIIKKINTSLIFCFVIILSLQYIYIISYINLSYKNFKYTETAIDTMQNEQLNINKDIENMIVKNDLFNKKFCIINQLVRYDIETGDNYLKFKNNGYKSLIQKSSTYNVDEDKQCFDSNLFIIVKPLILDKIPYYKKLNLNTIDEIKKKNYDIYLTNNNKINYKFYKKIK